MRKRIIAVCAAAVCITLAGIGSTIAYYTDTGNVINELGTVGPDGIAGILTEPEWRPEKGLDILPNEEIPKDPQVTNTSEADLNILTALKVEFVYGENCPDVSKRGRPLTAEDMAHLCDVYEIDWNSDTLRDWIRFDGETQADQTQHFYYSGILKRNYPDKGDTTVPLFTKLSVPKEVNNRCYSYIQAMGGFDIRINGVVVQQMTGETEFGLNSAKEAYETGLFIFEQEDM